MRPKLRYCLLFVFLTLLSCRLSAPTATPTEGTPTGEQVETISSPDELKPFKDGFFEIAYPDWPEDTEAPSESALGVSQGGFGLWVNRYETVPRSLEGEIRKHLDVQASAQIVEEDQWEGHPLVEYTVEQDGLTLQFRSVLFYCQAKTYAVVFMGIEGEFHQREQLFGRVLDSARCADPVQVSNLSTGKLGMTVNPPDDDPVEGTYPALRLAKESGVQVIHTHLQWGEIETAPREYDWAWNDHVMGLRAGEGFEISLVVNLIHTAVRGPIPDDLADLSFDDPVFIERFNDFILAALERYPVQYLSVGNEVNDYFVDHGDEIEAYRIFFLRVKEAVQAEHPDVKMAMTFAYHNAETMGALDIVDKLNVGDFLPFTLYIYSPGFIFDQDPGELAGYLDRMLSLAGDTPVALVELGWNTSERIGGSQADQAEFVRQAFDQLSQHRERIEFMSWFLLHDGARENCRQAALSFIPHRPDLAEDEEFMTPFVDFLCHLGLRENDGTPKLGWEVYREEANQYLTEYSQ